MKIIDHVSLAATVAAIVLATFAFCVRAEPSPSADYVEGEKSQALLTPELRAMAVQLMGENADALLHAVQLNMGKYDLDMRSADGRRRWHGKLIREEVSTNGLYKVQVFSNEVTGAIWRYREGWKPHRAATPRPPALGTNGVPVRLAAARARRNAELAGQKAVTNLVIEANR